MKRTVVIGIAVAVVMSSAALGRLLAMPGVQAVEPGFTRLFNGKDFTGWKFSGPPASFTIQDGAMVANGAVSHPSYDGPFRNHSFRNFELKVDIMTRAGSNGGVDVLTEYQERAFPSKGFEIQVNNTQGDRVKTGSLYHVKDVLDVSPVKDDEWFKMIGG